MYIKMFKRLVVPLLIVTLLLIPSYASAGTDYSAVGIIKQVECVRLIDNTDYNRLDFTIETKRGTEAYTALVPVYIVPTEIMHHEPNTLYRVRMNRVNGIWYIETFDLLVSMDFTTTPRKKVHSYSMPSGIFYNRDAIGDEWAIRIEFREINTPPLEILANAIDLVGTEANIDDISDRITDQTQILLERWLRYEPAYPNLTLDQRVETIGVTKYEVTRFLWFGFHVYSLDNPLTPENELNFTTIVSQVPLPDNWW